EDDEVRLLDLLVGGRAAAHPEDCRQTDDARGVSGPVAAVDVVAAHDHPGELLRQVVGLVRGLRAAEHPEGPRPPLLHGGAEAAGSAVQRLVPAGGTQRAAATDERGEQPLVLGHRSPPDARSITPAGAHGGRPPLHPYTVVSLGCPWPPCF